MGNMLPPNLYYRLDDVLPHPFQTSGYPLKPAIHLQEASRESEPGRHKTVGGPKSSLPRGGHPVSVSIVLLSSP